AVAGVPGHLPTGIVDFSFGAIDLGTKPLVNGVATLTTSALPMGTDSVFASYLCDTNYQSSNGNTIVFIDRPLLTIRALPTSKLYGAPLPSLGYSATGFVDGDTNSIFSGSLATTGTAASNVGLYPIAQGTLSAGAKYDTVFVPGNLNVTPAPLSITPSFQTKVYGAALPALTFTSAGFVNGDTAALLSGSLGTSATAASDVGNYPITRGTLEAGANYSLALSPANVNVVPAALTITPTAVTTTYGAPVPNLGFTVSGLVNGDTTTVVSGALA